MTEHVIPALKEGAARKSCETCRHMRKDGASLARDKSSTCAVLGRKPIDLIIMSKEEALASHHMIGGSCRVYDDPDRPGVVGLPLHRPVAFPLRDEPEPSSEYMIKSCISCTTCENFIQSTVIKSLGFDEGAGMCSVRGTLLDPHRYAEIASKCEFRRKGENVSGTDAAMVQVFPEYSIERVRTYMKSLAEQEQVGCLPQGYDPQTYVNPIPTSVEHQAMGIRTWVPVTDPSGTGNKVSLPVFDPSFFSTVEQMKIPKSTDDERPDLYVDHSGSVFSFAVAWMELDETPVVWGSAGVGKTEILRHLAWAMSLPFERISITGQTELDDLQGGMRFENGETVFHEGRVPLAWAKPCVLLVDEPNVGPREVWQFFRPLTDNSKQLVVDANNGIPIYRNNFCYFGMAMNPAWDPRNDGANTLADPDIRRLFHIEMGLPPENIERQIIKTHCALDGFMIPDKLLDMVMKVAESIRAAAVTDLPISWGIGTQIKVSRYLNWFEPVRAYRLAAANSLEPDVREIILNDVRTCFALERTNSSGYKDGGQF
jgi:MoxR-like ATPase